MSLEISGHKLSLHPERVAEWMEKGDCCPIYIEIGPTNYCNHKCVFCALDFIESGTNFIDKEIMLKALKEMGEHGVKSIMFAGEGESTLHKDIGSFVQTAKKNGIDVAITTNGVPLTKKKIEQCLPYLSWIRFSIDSGSAENYALIHGTNNKDFERLIKNIETCTELKNKRNLEVVIGAQFLAINENLKEISKLAKIMSDVGVDNLQIKPYSQHPLSTNKFAVGMDEFNILEKEAKSFETDSFKIIFRKATAQRIAEGITYPQCYGLSFFALADSKGNIIPCNLFYNKPEFIYGNLYKNSFSEIWNGEKRKEILKKLEEWNMDNCRRACRLDVINRYLHRVKNPQTHDNFI